MIQGPAARTGSPGDAGLPRTTDLRHLQRLAMLGTLATGLGHDLRNLVMPILLRLDVLAAGSELSDAARADLAGIRRSIADLQRLAGGLRLLSADPFEPRGEARVTQLQEWWLELKPVLVDALSADTAVAVEFPDPAPLVELPPTVLAQVVMNLVLNARRALDGSPAPRLTVTARRDEDRLRLFIADNGRGMDADTRTRCFEPFFTTRPREYATGLGLSTGRALMRRHGGDLTLASSAEGVGATFVLDLPVSYTAAAAATGGRGVRILIDEPRLRAMVRRVISHRGWRPIEAADDVAHVIICDAMTVQRALAVLAASNDRRPRIFAIGVAPDEDPYAAAGVQWVDPVRLNVLGDLLR